MWHLFPQSHDLLNKNFSRISQEKNILNTRHSYRNKRYCLYLMFNMIEGMLTVESLALANRCVTRIPKSYYNYHPVSFGYVTHPTNSDCITVVATFETHVIAPGITIIIIIIMVIMGMIAVQFVQSLFFQHNL